MPRRNRHLIAVAFVIAGALIGAALALPSARSEVGSEDQFGRTARCASRVSLAILGRSPSDELLAAPDPQAMVAAMLADPVFVNRFARFANASLNEEPGLSPQEDATFWLAQKIVGERKPWRELFTGPYRVQGITGPNGKPTAEVVDDPDGLGYFRSPAWMRRYAGNEEGGYRLVSAYRIMQNTIGLQLTAMNSNPDIDPTATGRMAPQCRVCHYDGPFALDLVAKILSRRQGLGMNMTFIPPSEGPQTLFDGEEIANDAELVNTLVGSVNFRFRACRLAFQYLYGRDENQCEAAQFDACMAAFEETGIIQDALEVVATDPSFCD